eukprot:6908105-Prymnesium_polylepis.1
MRLAVRRTMGVGHAGTRRLRGEGRRTWRCDCVAIALRLRRARAVAAAGGWLALCWLYARAIP